MSETHYTLKVAGIERELKKVRVAPGLVIASFVMLGDTELVERCAEALLPKMPREELDLLVCLEAKGIPLTHALARRLSLDYVTVRKSVKSYMEDPLVVEVRSITTQAPQTLVLDGVDRRRLRGRRVGVVDDVVSTGGSLKAVEALLSQAEASVSCRVAVLLEEGGYHGEGLIYLEKLPIFPEGR